MKSPMQDLRLKVSTKKIESECSNAKFEVERSNARS